MNTSSHLTSERYIWLDNAKMFAMLCVIFGHSSSLVVNGMPGRLLGLVVSFNMPLFVLLAGFTAERSFQRILSFSDLVDYIGKIYHRLLLPAVFLSAINQIFVTSLFARRLWLVFTVVAILEWFLEKWKNLLPDGISLSLRLLTFAFLIVASQSLNMFWFLNMLMKLQLSVAAGSFFISYFTSDAKRFLYVAAFSWALSFLVFDSWTFEMSFYFFVGLLLKRYWKQKTVLEIPVYWPMLAVVVGIVLLRNVTVNYGFYDYGLSRLIEMGLPLIYVCRLLVALALIFSILFCILKFSKRETWFSRMGQYSMAFYIVHALILETWLKPYVVANQLFVFEPPISTMFWLLVSIFLTMLSYGIILISARYRITRTLIIGK